MMKKNRMFNTETAKVYKIQKKNSVATIRTNIYRTEERIKI